MLSELKIDMRWFLYSSIIFIASCGVDIYQDSNPALKQNITLSPVIDGWNATVVDVNGEVRAQTTAVKGVFSPKSTKDCPASTTSDIVVEPAETIELIVMGGDEPRGLCIPELNLDVEAFPGILESRIIKADKPGRFCGVCQSDDGNYVLSSAIAIQIEDK